MTDWQDISTAPKDGTVVLVRGGVWMKRSDRKPLREEDEKGVRGQGGVTLACYYNPWIDNRFPWSGVALAPLSSEPVGICLEPTHWMPLPLPPAPVLESE